MVWFLIRSMFLFVFFKWVWPQRVSLHSCFPSSHETSPWISASNTLELILPKLSTFSLTTYNIVPGSRVPLVYFYCNNSVSLSIKFLSEQWWYNTLACYLHEHRFIWWYMRAEDIIVGEVLLSAVNGADQVTFSGKKQRTLNADTQLAFFFLWIPGTMGKALWSPAWLWFFAPQLSPHIPHRHGRSLT